MAWCYSGRDGLYVKVHVVPNAAKTEICGVTEEDCLKIRLHAPPVDGKANEALVRYVAKRLALPRSAVQVTQGQSARKKTLHVLAPNLTPDEAVRMLALENAG